MADNSEDLIGIDKSMTRSSGEETSFFVAPSIKINNTRPLLQSSSSNQLTTSFEGGDSEKMMDEDLMRQLMEEEVALMAM